ncbi:hypothetical protein PGB90_006467 [Kerria lacca]
MIWKMLVKRRAKMIGYNLRHSGMLVRRNNRKKELERKIEAKLRRLDIEGYRVQVLCRDEETCIKKDRNGEMPPTSSEELKEKKS